MAHLLKQRLSWIKPARQGDRARLVPVILTAIFFSLSAGAAPAATQLGLVTWRSEAPRLWEQLIGQFETAHPGIEVVREIAPNSSNQFHDLVSQKLRNRDPTIDVFFMDVIWPAEFAAAGWVLPLDGYFSSAAQKEFLAAPLHANRYAGQIFGVPLFVDAGMLYFRKDLLAKYKFTAPRTWPELVQQAETILAREGDPHLTGYSAQFKQYEGLVCNMLEFIMGNGAALWDGQTQTSALASGQAVAAVRFVRDRIVRRIAQRGVLSYQEPESLALFTQGRAIFHRNWPYAWEVANDPARSKVAGQVGTAPLPSFPGYPSVTTLGGWQVAISRFSRHPEAAWRLVDFLTGAPAQKQIALATGRGPTRKALYRDPELLAKIPQLAARYELFEQAAARPLTPVYLPLSNIMQRYFSSAVALSDSDIDRLARLAARDMDRVLDLVRQREAR